MDLCEALQRELQRRVRLFANGMLRTLSVEGIRRATIHCGGRIKFGPCGKLYIGTGDASNPGLAQLLNSTAGKILRINGDGAIPADSPFPDSPVFSLDHRNVQGLLL